MKSNIPNRPSSFSYARAEETKSRYLPVSGDDVLTSSYYHRRRRKSNLAEAETARAPPLPVFPIALTRSSPDHRPPLIPHHPFFSFAFFFLLSLSSTLVKSRVNQALGSRLEILRFVSRASDPHHIYTHIYRAARL